MAVTAMREGASDFVEKLHDAELLIACIERTLANDHRLKSLGSEQQLLSQRAAELSPRRREVMDLVTAGISREQIAVPLGISQYRGGLPGWIMERMDASNVAELARKVLVLDEGRFRWGCTALPQGSIDESPIRTHRSDPGKTVAKRRLLTVGLRQWNLRRPSGSDRP